MKDTILLGSFLVLGLLVTTGHSTKVFAQTDWQITGNPETDPTTNFLGTTDRKDLVIRTNKTERIRVNKRGRVGIGTDDPDQLLDVEIVDRVTDSVSYPARLSHVTSGAPEQGFGTGLEFQIGGARGSDATLGTIESVLTDATVGAEESALHFKTTDTGDDGLVSRMSINKDGNVTIGGTGSSAKLNVTGDNGQSILSLRRQGPGIFSASAVIVDSDGQMGINAVPSANLHVGGPPSDGTTTTTVKIGNSVARMFLDGDNIDSWRDLPGNLIPIPLRLNRFSSGNVELTTGGGNVGIGTSSPNTRLHIDGGTDASLSGGGYLTIGSGENANIVMDNNEIIARDDGNVSTLHLQNEGGLVAIGANGVSDASLSGGGFLTTGSIGGTNIVMDNNEIMARNGTSTSVLHLQAEGGAVAIGAQNSGSADVRIEADSSNSDENAQPSLTLVQDGGQVVGTLGYFGGTNNLRVVNQFGGARMIFEGDGDVCIGSAC